MWEFVFINVHGHDGGYSRSTDLYSSLTNGRVAVRPAPTNPKNAYDIEDVQTTRWLLFLVKIT